MIFLATAGARLIGQVHVDLAVRDDDLAIHLALAQADHRQFAANFLAESRVVDAVLLQRRLELLRRQLVVGGNLGDRLVKLGIIHLEARLAGKLHLDAIHDHPLQQLALEHVLRRQVRVLLLQLLERGCETLPQVVLRNDLVADDRNDAVGLDRIGGCRAGWRPEETGRNEGKNGKAAEIWVHGGHCVVSRLLEVFNSLVLP